MNAIESSFKHVKSQKIDALNLEYQEYDHSHTKAKHIHLAAENQENVFLVALRTVPTDSTGVAHILEHTSLCGSEKYPVRDPFFMMIRRSLNTFMNAFTSSDWTAYPFASQNRKDFDNLLKVYLDAVFFARLDPLDFAQEGHRLEFEKAGDASSELQFKGVVFNEMKGAMSAINSQLWQAVGAALFPETTYHYNSGGDPEKITDLSYEQLKAFYQTHYHPDNAVFITYGDIDAQTHQKNFESLALQRFKPINQHIEVPLQSRFTTPLRSQHAYQLAEGDDANNSTHQVMAWVIGDILDPADVMLNHLLASILLENSASPLQHALETTELGSSPSPLCGMDDSGRQLVFVCGLQGCTSDSTEAFESLITSTLQKVVDNGIEQEQLTALLDQLELQQREISGDGYPYGLQIILTCLATAMHRGDPEAVLDIDPILLDLREKIKQPDFVANLVKTKLLDNPHRVTVTLQPDEKFADKLRANESARLAEIREQLNDEDVKRIMSTAEALQQRQQTKDNPELLPKVSLSDVPDDIEVPECREFASTSIKTTFYPQGTNGITYREIISSLPAMETEKLALLSLHNRVLTETGLGSNNYLATQNRQTKVCGGISAYSSFRSSRDSEQQTKSYFVLSSKGLSSHSNQIDELLFDTLHSARFDELQRIRELVSLSANRAEQSVTGNGHGLAMAIACQTMSPIARLNHRSSGVLGIQSLKNLDKALAEKSEQEKLSESLTALHAEIINSEMQALAIGEETQASSIENSLGQLWGNKTDSSSATLSLESIRERTRELWLCNTQVNFCAKAYPTVSAGHADAAPLTVLGGVLRNGYLHTAIREQGGAYGSGANQDSGNAAFRFFSYRDPRLGETLDDFDKAIQWLLAEDLEWRVVEEAILGTISSIDKPASPAGTAKHHFHNSLFDRTPEHIRDFRQSVLGVTQADLKRVAETYFAPEKASIGIISHRGETENYTPLCNTLEIEIKTL